MKPAVIAVIVVAVVVALITGGGLAYHFVMADKLQGQLAEVIRLTARLSVVPSLPDPLGVALPSLPALVVPASATAAVLASRGTAQGIVQRLEVERQVLEANGITSVTFPLPSVRWARINAIVADHAAIVARDAAKAAMEASALVMTARDHMASNVVAIEAAIGDLTAAVRAVETAIATLPGASATPHHAAQLAVDAAMADHRAASERVRTARANFESNLAQHAQHVATYQGHRAQAVTDRATSTSLMSEAATIASDIAADIRRAAAVPLPLAARNPRQDANRFTGLGHVVEVDAATPGSALAVTVRPTMTLYNSIGDFDVDGVRHTLRVSQYQSYVGPESLLASSWVLDTPIVMRGMAQVVTMGAKQVVIVKHPPPPIRTGVFLFFSPDAPDIAFKANITNGRVYDNRLSSRGVQYGTLSMDNSTLTRPDGMVLRRDPAAPANAHDYRHTDSTGATTIVRFVELARAANIPSERLTMRKTSGSTVRTFQLVVVCGVTMEQSSDNSGTAMYDAGTVWTTTDRWRTFVETTPTSSRVTYQLQPDGRWTAPDGSSFEILTPTMIAAATRAECPANSVPSTTTVDFPAGQWCALRPGFVTRLTLLNSQGGTSRGSGYNYSSVGSAKTECARLGATCAGIAKANLGTRSRFEGNMWLVNDTFQLLTNSGNLPRSQWALQSSTSGSLTAVYFKRS